MSTTYISKILEKVMEITGDAVPSQTSKLQMVSWLCEGEREYVKKKPDTYIKTADSQMIEGTRQTLESDGILFIKPICNMGTAGTAPGDVVFLSDENQLNRADPSWHAATANSVIKSVTFSPDDPKTFYTYPPQPTSEQGFLRYRYSAIPPEITITGDDYDVVYNIGDECASELVNYILARIYSKDGGQILGADSIQRAQMYYGLFTGDLQHLEAVEAAKDPNRKG